MREGVYMQTDRSSIQNTSGSSIGFLSLEFDFEHVWLLEAEDNN